jgi:hypothetical protein
MGGLKMDFTMEIAHGLVLNRLQRLRAQGRVREEDRSFLFTLFNKAVRTTNLLSLEEIFRIGAPKYGIGLERSWN